MRYKHTLPALPFELGNIVFSPGIIAALQTSSSLRSFIDEMLEFHSATEFGIITRATRFDNTMAALLGTGRLLSRFFIPKDVWLAESAIIITTHLDEHTTTIRFPGEQE